MLAAEPTVCFHFSVRCKRATTRARAEAFAAGHLGGFGDRVQIHWDHPDFAALVAAMDAQILPAEHLYTKVDAPLVALEAMAHGQPVFCLDRAPLDELVPPALRARLVASDDAGLIACVRAAVQRDAATVAADSRDLHMHVVAHFSAAHAARQYGAIHADARL